MNKGCKCQKEMETSRASDGKIREVKHVDLYNLPSGQKSSASKKTLGTKQV
jgi:hypothetical protein